MSSQTCHECNNPLTANDGESHQEEDGYPFCGLVCLSIYRGKQEVESRASDGTVLVIEVMHDKGRREKGELDEPQLLLNLEKKIEEEEEYPYGTSRIRTPGTGDMRDILFLYHLEHADIKRHERQPLVVSDPVGLANYFRELKLELCCPISEKEALFQKIDSGQMGEPPNTQMIEP